MDISLVFESIGAGGGTDAFDPITARLENSLVKDYRLNELTIVSFLPISSDSLTDEEKQKTKQLPSARLNTKSLELELRYLNSQMIEEDAFRSDKDFSGANINRIELGKAINLIAPKIRKRKEIDGHSLVNDIQKALRDPILGEEEIRIEREPGIIHGNMAHDHDLLKDDFFWDLGDDFAPHGSNIGAQVWKEYQTIESHLTVAYLDDLLQEFQDNDLFVRYQVVLAIAFGQIKQFGKIHAYVKTKLEKSILDVIQSGILGEMLERHKSEFFERLSQIELVLSQVPVE